MIRCILKMHGERVTILSRKKEEISILKIGKTKLWRNLLLCCAISAAAAALSGVTVNRLLTVLVERYVDNPESELRYTDEVMDEFQEYVTEKELSIYDTKEVLSWIEDKGELDIYFGGPSELIELVKETEDKYVDTVVDVGLYDYGFNSYDIRFSDGTIKSYPILYRAVRYYDFAFIVAIFLAGNVFVYVLLALVRKRLAYIVKLSDEMKILEAGNLDYEITVKGKDEIACLGKSINDMRKAVIEKMQKESEAISANEELITAISHDLRTPLTKQIGYLEILERKKYKDAEQEREYLQKTKANAYAMKEITDQLFRYFLAFSKGRNVEEWVVINGKNILEKLLEEQGMFLKSQGFQVNIAPFEQDFEIRINEEEFGRIFDNLFINIGKYADAGEEVTIFHNFSSKYFVLSLKNGIKKEKQEFESTKIGLRIVENFMKHMGGRAKVIEAEDRFEIVLYFPIL